MKNRLLRLLFLFTVIACSACTREQEGFRETKTQAASTAASTFSSADPAERAIYRRAIEAINWGMPAVNLDLMRQAGVNAGAKSNQIVYWSGLPDWKIQTLTPNPDVIYLKPFFNTKDPGPMVLEIPPAEGGSITGTIMDAWQSALEDVGPAGVDKGKGGKYLILPPGYEGVPPKGYIPLRSMTYQGYALLRSILASTSDADVAKAVAYARRIRLYPLSQVWLDARYEAGFPSFYESGRWAFPAIPELGETMGTFYEKADGYAMDGRGLGSSYAYSTVKHLGGGQFYLMTAKDKDGRALDGAANYKLNVPADAPIKQYWSAVVYDRETHAPVREVSRPSRSSQSEGMQKNTDGSVDIYFGPQAPSGKESNWIPTRTDGQFEVLFRLYGPEKSFFEKVWKLPDIEKLP